MLLFTIIVTLIYYLLWTSVEPLVMYVISDMSSIEYGLKGPHLVSVLTQCLIVRWGALRVRGLRCIMGLFPIWKKRSSQLRTLRTSYVTFIFAVSFWWRISIMYATYSGWDRWQSEEIRSANISTFLISFHMSVSNDCIVVTLSREDSPYVGPACLVQMDPLYTDGSLVSQPVHLCITRPDIIYASNIVVNLLSHNFCAYHSSSWTPGERSAIQIASKLLIFHEQMQAHRARVPYCRATPFASECFSFSCYLQLEDWVLL